jgi:hypothetical protein
MRPFEPGTTAEAGPGVVSRQTAATDPRTAEVRHLAGKWGRISRLLRP